MGDAMAISFEPLTSAQHGWNDGLHWLNEVKNWSERYGKANLRPNESNKKLAEGHLDLLFLNLPKCMKFAGRQLVGILLGERLREAMM